MQQQLGPLGLFKVHLGVLDALQDSGKTAKMQQYSRAASGSKKQRRVYISRVLSGVVMKPRLPQKKKSKTAEALQESRGRSRIVPTKASEWSDVTGKKKTMPGQHQILILMFLFVHVELKI